MRRPRCSSSGRRPSSLSTRPPVFDNDGYSALPVLIFNYANRPQDEFRELASAGCDRNADRPAGDELFRGLAKKPLRTELVGDNGRNDFESLNGQMTQKEPKENLTLPSEPSHEKGLSHQIAVKADGDDSGVDVWAKDKVFEVKDVTVSYANKAAVKDVTMDIYKNEVTAMIGPSGCGKSTLLRCLNRMNDLVPSARVDGEIFYHGQDLYGPTASTPVQVRQDDRHGLPEAESVPEVDLRQHRLRAPGARTWTTSTSASRRRSRARPSGTRSRTASETTPTACPVASSSGSASPAPWPSTPR